MRRTCIVNNDFSFTTLMTALAQPANTRQPSFDEQLAAFSGVEKCLLTSSGFAALEVILRSLRELRPGKTDVVIPAYTAPGLVLPILRLGLVPRLCDISLATFNLDPAKLPDTLADKTLAVIAVDMFGLPADVAAIRAAAGSSVFIVDDCAQALGTEHTGVKAGASADIGFGSFGRGKNFSLYGGGFIALHSSPLAEIVLKNHALLPAPPSLSTGTAAVRHILFSWLSSPMAYAVTAPALSQLKSTREQDAYSACRMGDVTEFMGRKLFTRWREEYRARRDNGRALQERLSGNDGILLARAADDSLTAYNRFPVVVVNAGHKGRILSALQARHIEASPMYKKPVHLLRDIGYRAGDFPAAEFFASHLVTLPVHGQVTTGDIEAITDTFILTRRDL